MIGCRVSVLVLFAIVSTTAPAWSQPSEAQAGSKPALSLMDSLFHPEARIRQNALEAIKEQENKPFAEILALLESEEMLKAATGAVLLKEIASEETPLPDDVRGKLYGMLKDQSSPAWRWNIVANLLATEKGMAGDSLADAENVELWKWGVQQRHPMLQLPSLRALQKAGPAGKTAQDAVAALLDHAGESPLTGIAIHRQIIADQQIGFEQAIPAYDALLILETLVAIEADVKLFEKHLLKLTDHDSEYIRLDAAAMLGKIPVATARHHHAATVLAQLAISPTSNVRVEAVRELSQIREATEERVAVLSGLLKDRNDDVRMEAARSLGKMGPAAKPAIPDLKHAMQSAPLDTTEAVQTIRDAILAIDPMTRLDTP